MEIVGYFVKSFIIETVEYVIGTLYDLIFFNKIACGIRSKMIWARYQNQERKRAEERIQNNKEDEENSDKIIEEILDEYLSM